MKKNIKYYTLIFSLLFTGIIYSQVKTAKHIQYSKIATNNQNKLYFIDFWATWCKPCVYASDYLSVLQKEFPHDFYVVSINNESLNVTERFIKKYPTDLAVFSDYNGETFKTNNILVLPYGVLLNANGEILWKGDPTDFKSTNLKRFLSQNSKKAAINDIFQLQNLETNEVNFDYQLTSDVEITQLEGDLYDEIQVNSFNHFIEIKGSLQQILAYSLKVIDKQITLDWNLNKNYQVLIKNEASIIRNLPLAISKKLNIQISESEGYGLVLVLNVDKAKFWDTNQINWGSTTNYILDDSQVQADNMTFNDVVYQLASVLKNPVLINSKYFDNALHDWQIHYKFYNLMQSDLLDNYGIVAENKNQKFLTYTIKKETP